MIAGLRRAGGREFSLNTCHILECFKMGRKTAQRAWPEALFRNIFVGVVIHSDIFMLLF